MLQQVAAASGSTPLLDGLDKASVIFQQPVDGILDQLSRGFAGAGSYLKKTSFFIGREMYFDAPSDYLTLETCPPVAA